MTVYDATLKNICSCLPTIKKASKIGIFSEKTRLYRHLLKHIKIYSQSILFNQTSFHQNSRKRPKILGFSASAGQ